MANNEDSKITLEIDGATALVVFEMLARFEKLDELTLEDSAETYALWVLLGALERRIVAPFEPDYDRELARARKILRRRHGGESDERKEGDGQ